MSPDDDSEAAAAAAVESVAAISEKICASCGTAAIDDVKLKPCPHCDLVEYCSDLCQQDHREKHEAACKKRAAELYGEVLFKQPVSTHLGDCPICFLPMPLDGKKSVVNACCCQRLCTGCHRANLVQQAKEGLKERRCPFCRHIVPKTLEDSDKLIIERAKLNDPNALHKLGYNYHKRGDNDSAFHYWGKAAEVGDVDSMFNLSVMYRKGEGVEEDKDKGRALLEKAAIAGHLEARFNLGCIEERNGRIDRAVTHWILGANLGDEGSIKTLKQCYKKGHISKDDFAAALRANQAAVDATKSPQRAEAERFGY